MSNPVVWEKYHQFVSVLNFNSQEGGKNVKGLFEDQFAGYIYNQLIYLGRQQFFLQFYVTLNLHFNWNKPE